MHKHFSELEKFYEFFDDEEDVLLELEDYEECGGKHDCTNCSGYFYSEKFNEWFFVSFIHSYNDGILELHVEGPFTKEQEQVSIIKNVWKKK